MPLFQKNILSTSELQQLTDVIAEAEKKTCGEIRVVVRHRRNWKERKLTLHEIALKEFVSLGMQNTRERTGVLILLLLSKRAFHIVADEGIHRKVEDGTWERIAALMSGHFRKGNFFDGIADAIRAVGAELANHFPRGADGTDQLPNDVIER